MKFAGVVVVFNPGNEVKNNIKTYINYLDKLYVVDNSNENNLKMFKDIKKVSYISNNGNLGIATALNIGAQNAINEGYEWLLTMDQDSNFENNHLKRLEDFINKLCESKELNELLEIKYEKVGIVAPFYKLNTDYEACKGIGFPLMVMTSGNLINLNVYQAIGGFKDWFFIDCVDFDYCLNLKKNGYEIIQLNNCVLNHHLGNEKVKKILCKTISSSNHSALRRYYMVRNRHYLYDLYNKDFPGYCNLEIGRTRIEAIKLLLVEKQKIKKIRYMIRGYKDYKKGIKGKFK